MPYDPTDNLTAALLPHDTFWAIEPLAGMRLWELCRGQNLHVHMAEVAAKTPQSKGEDEDKPSKPYMMLDGVAILGLTGPLTKSPTSMGMGTSTIRFRQQLRAARRDDDVQSAIIVADSPGGSVAGTADAADEVAAFASLKPIVGYVEDGCCSAAYWILSQCSQVFANRTALTGSIGTVMVLNDSSKMYSRLGMEPVVFGTGKFKGAGTPGVALTDEQRTYFQGIVNSLNAHFVAAVQPARGMSAEQMETLLEAGVHVGADAMALNLIDGIGTLDDAHAWALAYAGRPAAAIAGRTQGVSARLPRWQEVVAAQEAATAQTPVATEQVLVAPSVEVEATTEVSAIGGTTRTAPILPASHTPTIPATDAGRTPTQWKESKMDLRQSLVNTLKRLNLNHMAVAVVAATDDSTEAMACALSSEVEAEVEKRVQANSMIMACDGAGLKQPSDLRALMDLAEIGRASIFDAQVEAKAEAIRAYGAEQGALIGAQVMHMPLAQIKTMRKAWSAQANAAFDIPADGKTPATRFTAPRQNPEALDATGADDKKPKTAWEQLTPYQREIGLKMGMSTAQKQETFAQERLSAFDKAVA